jgi:hypothetical protein
MVHIFLLGLGAAPQTVIRLCVETPTAGGRVFETGDEELLKFVQKISSAFSISLIYYTSTHFSLSISSHCDRFHSIRPTREDEESRVERGSPAYGRPYPGYSERGGGLESV